MKRKIRKLLLFIVLTNVDFLECMEKEDNSDEKFVFFDELPIELRTYILKLSILHIFQNNKSLSEIIPQASRLLSNVLPVNKKFRSLKNELIEFFLEECKKYLGSKYGNLNLEQKNQKLKEGLLAEEKNEKDLSRALRSVLDGADPNLIINTDVQTPRCALNWAILWPSIELTSLLLIKGANVNFRNINGYTPLMFAVSQGTEEIVKMLLHHKADISLENNSKETALTIARKNGHSAIIDILEKAK